MPRDLPPDELDTQPPLGSRVAVPMDYDDRTPIPARVFFDTVERFERELDALREELHDAHQELAKAREDLSEVLAILRSRDAARARMWGHVARVCSTFLGDARVRLIVAIGVVAWPVLLLLVLAGASSLEYDNGAIRIGSPAAVNEGRAEDMNVDESGAALSPTR